MIRTRSAGTMFLLRLEALEARDVPSFLPPVAYYVGKPAGVAIVDLNADGRRDVAVVMHTDLGILLGDGTGALGPVTTYPIDNEGVGIRAADLNLDGRPDLVVGFNKNVTVSVLLNNGNGTFQPAINAHAGFHPRHLAVGDFDKDGMPDLAVTSTTESTEGWASILRGNGDGTFQAPMAYPTGATPNEVEVGDLNGDGWTDVTVANGFSKSVSVLLNTGDGSFLPHVEHGIPEQPWGHELGDFNKDHRLDMVVANGSSNVSVLLGNGDGTFNPAVNYSSGGVIAIFPAVADFNKDRKSDIAVTHYYTDGSQTQPVSVLLGNGTGTFQPAQNHPFGIGSYGMAAGDLNNDRFPDIVVGDTANNDVRVLLNDGNWPAPIVPPQGPEQDGVEVQSASRTPVLLPARAQAVVLPIDKTSARSMETLTSILPVRRTPFVDVLNAIPSLEIFDDLL